MSTSAALSRAGGARTPIPSQREGELRDAGEEERPPPPVVTPRGAEQGAHGPPLLPSAKESQTRQRRLIRPRLARIRRGTADPAKGGSDPVIGQPTRLRRRRTAAPAVRRSDPAMWRPSPAMRGPDPALRPAGSPKQLEEEAWRWRGTRNGRGRRERLRRGPFFFGAATGRHRRTPEGSGGGRRGDR
jgi:hypothetical protein